MTRPLLTFLQGMVIGAANIIPGVSGGTMALVLGIYDHLLGAIGRWGPKSAVAFAHAVRSPRRRSALADFARRHEVSFLAWLAAGGAAAILLLSRLLEFLLELHPQPTYGFFFGLVLVSVVVPWSLLRRKSWPELVAGIAGIGLMVACGLVLSPEARIEARREAQAIRASTPAAEVSVETSVAGDDASPASNRLERAVVFALSGAVGIAAMILPGLSGSFVLLLLGVYFDVLRAINRGDIVLLAAFGAGCAIGGLLFVRFLSFLVARFRDPTLAFITGLMVGSLWEIWPFAEIVRVGDEVLRGAKRWPALDEGATWGTIAAALGGGAAVVVSLVWERRAKRTRKGEAGDENPAARVQSAPFSGGRESSGK